MMLPCLPAIMPGEIPAPHDGPPCASPLLSPHRVVPPVHEEGDPLLEPPLLCGLLDALRQDKVGKLWRACTEAVLLSVDIGTAPTCTRAGARSRSLLARIERCRLRLASRP